MCQRSGTKPQKTDLVSSQAMRLGVGAALLLAGMGGSVGLDCPDGPHGMASPAPASMALRGGGLDFGLSADGRLPVEGRKGARGRSLVLRA